MMVIELNLFRKTFRHHPTHTSLLYKFEKFNSTCMSLHRDELTKAFFFYFQQYLTVKLILLVSEKLKKLRFKDWRNF